MIIHAKAFFTGSTVTDVDDVSVQPNAVDIRVDRIFQLTATPFVLSETLKIPRGRQEIIPYKIADEENKIEEWFYLHSGYYEVVMKNTVKMAKRFHEYLLSSEAAIVIPRSTLIRNGVYLTSGLYDTGYEGTINAGMHVCTDGGFRLQRGARIGQFVIFKADALFNYNGSYQQHKSEAV